MKNHYVPPSTFSQEVAGPPQELYPEYQEDLNEYISY